jgi:hypothetical protein
LLWIVPLGLVLLVPIAGVVEKVSDAVALLADTSALASWRGDVLWYAPLSAFLGTDLLPGDDVLAWGVVALAAYGLWLVPRRVGIPLAVVCGGALLAAGAFRLLDNGEYVLFKILSTAGPIMVVAAVTALGSLAGRRRLLLRVAGVAGIALLLVAAVASTRREARKSYAQVHPHELELREWSDRIPPGASIRLDIPSHLHIWPAYLLADHPLGSHEPMGSYPHNPRSRGADYALDFAGTPPPHGYVGRAPVLANPRYRLWRLGPGAGRDTTSQRTAGWAQ